MAVTSNPGNSRFTLVWQSGTTLEGKPVLLRKSYNNVKWDAHDQDVYDVAQALGGLSQYPVVHVERYDNEVLADVSI